MAIVKDDLILASDVVDFNYKTKKEIEFKIVGKVFESVTDTETYFYKLPPKQKFRLSFDLFDKSAGEIKTTYFTRLIGSETWVEIGEIFDDTPIILLNADLTFKEIKIEVRMHLPGGFGGVTNRVDLRGESYLRPEIALQGEPLRVMNIDQTAWDSGLTLITVALYNTGRIGYE
jgi:hypothetical protein